MADQAGPVARSFKVYDFAALSRREPNRQQPGDRLDAQFSNLIETVNGLARTVEAQAHQIVQLQAGARAGQDPTGRPLADPLEGPQALGPNAGGFYAGDVQGATATSADYAQVSIAWAENMPWTIPGNILAINAVTGSHWSSRWWAMHAADLVAVIGSGNLAIQAERLPVTVANTLPLTSFAPVDALTTMQVIVNGKVYSAVTQPQPFTVAGQQIAWLGPTINPGDDVVVRYRYALPAAPQTAAYQAASLYYLAAPGQTVFPLSQSDMFANHYTLKATSTVRVSRSGQRLVPDDGQGHGGYGVAGDNVTLMWPAGAGEQVVIDIWEKYPAGS